jgi:hypothetical protein
MSHVVLIRRALWLLALASLTFGVWRSAQPEALADFHRVVEWSATVINGDSPYAGESDADYPPWALVTLAPVVGLPAAYRAPLWILFNLALVCGVAVMLVRAVPAARDIQLALASVLLSTAPFRVLGQFSILSYAFALAGAGHRSPVIGGLLMGLGLMKPQVGGVVVIAHLLMRDWTRAGVALCVPPVLLVIAGAWLSMSPLQLLSDYAAVLEGVHGGMGVTAGHTELEPWLAPLVPGATSVAGSAVLGLLLLLPALAGAIRTGPHWTARRRSELYALCGVASLLATRHLSYDLLLLTPLIVAWWPSPRTPWLITSSLLVLQLPGWWRRVFEPMAWPDGFGVILEVDRALCIVLFGLLVWRFMRLDVTK